MLPISMTIDDSFFREEERCGFLVTEERKKLWAVELDLLVQLDRVCRAHGLKYCVGAGTMLGAVRHKGFIPWDDDMDVYMMRPDYDRLMKLADEFQLPYLLQTSQNEKHLIRTYARVRNVMTTGTTKKELDLDVNKGIFIDIFPLDGVGEDEKTDLRQHRINTFQKNVSGCYNHAKGTGEGLGMKQKLLRIGYKVVAAVFVRDRLKMVRKMDRNLTLYSRKDTKIWGNRTLVFACPKSRRPKEEYCDLIDMPFEMITVPVPRAYDSMLTQQYGDYMKLPENKVGSVHGELIYSTEQSFEDFVRSGGLKK